MKLYDKIFSIVKSKFSVTNEQMTGKLVAELLVITSLLIVCLLFRHINVLLSAILIILLAVFILTSLPIFPKFESEQDDSLNKMLFYVIISLGVIITFLYWGARYVG